MIEWQPFGQKHIDFIQRPVADDARINILEGSVRSGKTVSMIPKWLIYLTDGPPGLLAMIGVSKDTIYDNVLRDLFDTVGEGNFSYNRQTGDLQIAGRSVKVIGAKDEGSEKYIRGKTLAGAYIDEMTLIPESFFKQLLNRMSVAGSKLYGTTNPDTPSHYIYKDYIADQDKRDSGMVRVIHFDLDDNPNLGEEYKSFIRSAYSGLFYKRFIQGLWVMGEGSIYDMWTDALVYNEMPFRAHTTSFIGIDYGTLNATCFLHVVDDGECLWIEREYYHSGRQGQQKTDAQYADALIEFIGGVDVNRVILDPSAASFKAELKARGVRIKDANNEVLDGIRIVSNMMARGKLRVNARCVNLIREIQSYRWDPKPADRGKEQPIKIDDHACDALRYVCATIIKPRRLVND